MAQKHEFDLRIKSKTGIELWFDPEAKKWAAIDRSVKGDEKLLGRRKNIASLIDFVNGVTPPARAAADE